MTEVVEVQDKDNQSHKVSTMAADDLATIISMVMTKLAQNNLCLDGND